MKRLATLTIPLVFAAARAMAQGEMPKPGPEHQAMSVFAGKWSFEGKIEDGPMGPGGPTSFTEACELFEGGFALVCRSEGKNPAGPVKALAVMSYDTEKKAYTYYGVESGMPVFMATGQSDGKTWNWKSSAKMGDQTMDTAVTVVLTSPTSQTFEMKMSTDGGKTWTSVISGKSTKSTS
jgi:hypothetical protein